MRGQPQLEDSSNERYVYYRSRILVIAEILRPTLAYVSCRRANSEVRRLRTPRRRELEILLAPLFSLFSPPLSSHIVAYSHVETDIISTPMSPQDFSSMLSESGDSEATTALFPKGTFFPEKSLSERLRSLTRRYLYLQTESRPT